MTESRYRPNPPVSRPRHLADIPTPALIVEVAAMERNIARMAAFFAEGPCRLRPHFKAHKTPEIARRQLNAGSVSGFTCATVSEAEVLARLCDNILIANEIVSPDKCMRVAELAGAVTVTVAVDSAVGLDHLAAAARRRGTEVAVLVDLNVGQNRCGIATSDAAVELARRADDIEGVRLAGVMGYEGHVQPIEERGARKAAAERAMQTLVQTAALIRGNGLPCDIVSAGGTGTYDISGRVAGVTEIQAGSYALMDSDYDRLDLPFEPAIFVLATVISRPIDERVVLDGGHKALTKDHGNPLVVGVSGAVVVTLNDEHATLSVPGQSPLQIGDRVRLRPSHVDPTVNLHDEIYAIDGDAVVDVWPVAARGYRQHHT